MIENTTNLSISPSQDVLSEGHDYVNISCNSAEIGFGFFNITNLTISSVVFHMCGGHPSSKVVKYVNETDQFLYYDSSVIMALFFSHCYNIKLHNTSTSLDLNLSHEPRVRQLQFVGVNLCGDSEIKTTIPDDTSEEGGNNSMAFFVYFTDTAILTPTLLCKLKITVSINGLTSSDHDWLWYYARLTMSDRVKLDYFSDLTVFLTQSFLVFVDLKLKPMHTPRDKSGLSTRAKVVFVNSDTVSQVNLQGYEQTNQLCSDNSETSMPISLYVLFYETSDFISSVTDILHPMRIHDTAFKDYQADDDVLVVQKFTGKLSHQVSLHNVSWCNNNNALPVQLLAQNLANSSLAPGELYLNMNNTFAHGNFFYLHHDTFLTSKCVMCFSHIKQISMTGTNYFAENGGGTVIKLVASELAVSGNLTIMDGHAYQGGGISMDLLSTLALEEPLVAGFYNNIADQGSAIYSSNDQYRYTGMSAIQIRPDKKYSLANVTSINISVYFNNNFESVIYRSFYGPHFRSIRKQISPNLLFNRTTWDSDRSQYAYTTLIDTILHMDRIDKYTSMFNGFCIQPHQQKWECGYLDNISLPDHRRLCEAPLFGSTVIYPAQTAFYVHFSHPNYLLVAVYCYNGHSLPPKYNVMCSSDNTSTLSCKFTYPPDKGGYYMAVLRDLNMDLNYNGLPIFQFNVSDCPLGFSLNNESCDCNNKLTSHGYRCDIDTETITSPPGYWTGVEEREDADLFLFDDLCLPDYCNKSKRDFHLTDDPAEACLGNRTGVLCGECKENYSVVFGSDTCYDHCTDVYLVTIPAYVLAGLLLVFLLFTLRITVATGTINGLIFYANVLGLVLDQLTEDKAQNSSYVAFVRVFISLLNLDLGFPLCFYEEMTMAGKVGFQFLFPVYLWSIVVMLILLSKCSIRLSELISKSSVQVLVTLFYLSFSKLLSTIIVIFSGSTISVIKGPGNYTSRIVWYYDGHDYGSNTHAILLALAVAFTLLFLFPYALLVTFSSLLLRFRIVNRFQNFIDAYGGPFKDKWRFWFGLRLWITILLFGLNGVLQGTNTNLMFIVIIVTVVSFTFLQNFIRPFKNSFIGALDLFFMVNYTLLVTSTEGIFPWMYIFMTASAVLATVLIVVGHLFALSDTFRAKCVNMLPQERNDYQYHEVMQDDDEDMDLFAAAEDRVQDTY